MINFLRIVGNIKLGDYLHEDGSINDIPSNDIIGVCVIPSNFLPDRYARFISLVQKYPFHQWGRTVELKSEYKRNLPGKRKGEMFSWGFIRNGYYGEGTLILTNPYLPNNSLDPEFLRDLPDGNAFQDYKGYENTKLYKEKYRNNGLPNVFTEAIKKSPSYKENEWYLPAIGELALIIPMFHFISNKMSEAFIAGSPGVILSSDYFWSSTEKDSESAWYVSLNQGYVNHFWKDGRNYILSFLAL